MSKRTLSIAAIPGDGIGPEVIDAGMELLKAVASATAAFRSSLSGSTGVRIAI